MLVQFRIKNILSFQDEAILSLESSSDKSHAATHLHSTNSTVVPKVLRSVALYGPNASGKSNLISALGFMKNMVLSSTLANEGKYTIKPFMLNNDCVDQPMEFEITFIESKIMYVYGFNLMSDRVNEEWLLVYKTAKPQKWFHRSFDIEKEKPTFEFGSYFRGQKQNMVEATKNRYLFLSVANQFNNEPLMKVYNWFQQKLVILSHGREFSQKLTMDLIRSEEGRTYVKDFLCDADIAISSITSEEKEGKLSKLELYTKTGEMSSSVEEKQFTIPVFIHKSDFGTAQFQLGEQSLGTQRLFYMAAPLKDVLTHGKILIVDEFEASLHPLLVIHLIKKFHDPSINSNGAQLIFSTHNTAIISSSIFRRDQIWFVERNDSLASTLFSLQDFNSRKIENWEKWYLEGRYGSIPFFNDENDLVELNLTDPETKVSDCNGLGVRDD